MCCNSPEPPKPDPALGQAAAANADIGRDSLAFNKQVYEEGKPRREAMDSLVQQIAGQQLSSANENQALSRDYANYMKTNFRPVEEGLTYQAYGLNPQEAAELSKLKPTDTSDASAWGKYSSRLNELKTNAETRQQEEAAGQAGGAVGEAAAATRGSNARDLARMGLDPSSGAYAAANESGRLGESAMRADAMNKARITAKNTLWAKQMDVANLGRNLPSNQATSAQIANQAGNSAVGNAGAGNTANLQAQGALNQGYGTATAANSAAGGLYGNVFDANMRGYAAQQAGAAGQSQGLGSIIGAGLANWQNIFSSKKVKHDKRAVNDGAVLDAVNDMPVEKWRYRPGVDDGGAAPHIGPYAEDMQKKFGVGDGKTIRVMDAVGVSMAAIQGLTKKVDRLEHALDRKVA
jgi:hypothetical protein